MGLKRTLEQSGDLHGPREDQSISSPHETPVKVNVS